MTGEVTGAPAHKLPGIRLLPSHLNLTETQKSGLCLLGLALLPFVLFWEVTLFRLIPFAGDIMSSGYPFQYYVQSAYRQGFIPVWSDHLLSGMPFPAVYGSFYPPSILLAFVPAWITTTYFVLANFGLCGAFTYLYARSLRLGRLGALAAGVTFMFCGFVVGHLGHQSVNRTLPWLPLALWAFENWRLRFKFKYLACGALAIGMLFLGGHPQAPAYAMGVIVAYILYFGLWPEERGTRKRIFLGALSMLGAGLIIASPVIWDLYDVQRFGGRGVSKDLAYQFFSGLSLTPRQLGQMLFPHLFEAEAPLVEMGGYVGVLPLALALVAVSRWLHRARLFWIAVTVFGVVLVLGANTPLHPLMFRVPIYNSFRVPPRNWYEVDFAIAILAGAGLNYLVTAGRTGLIRVVTTLRVPALVLALTAVACLAGLAMPAVQKAMLQNGFSGLRDWRITTPLILIGLSALVLLLWSWKPAIRIMPWLVIILIVADLYVSIDRQLITGQSIQRAPAQLFGELFPPGQVKALTVLPTASTRYRVLTYTPIAHLFIDDEYQFLAPDLNMLFGIDSADGYVGGLVANQYRDFTFETIVGDLPTLTISPRLFEPVAKNVLNLLNVRYILTTEPTVLCCNAPVSAGGIQFRNTPLPAVPYPPLNLNSVSGFISATVDLPAQPATDLALSVALHASASLPQGTRVARVTVTDQADRVSTYDLVAGENVAEAMIDCPGVKTAHKKIPVAFDQAMGANCTWHTYLARFQYSAKPIIAKRVTFEYLFDGAELSVDKMSLFDATSQASYPVSVTEGYLSHLSPANGYREIYHDGLVRIYENQDVLPRAFMVGQVQKIANAREAAKAVQISTLPDGRPFVATQLALIDGAQLPAELAALSEPGGPDADARAQATILPGHAGHIEVHTASSQAAFLVYSTTYFPGWHANVDGRPAPIYRTDGNLLGVSLPPGNHRVVFDYLPVSLYLAGLGFGVGLVIFAGLIVGICRRNPANSIG